MEDATKIHNVHQLKQKYKNSLKMVNFEKKDEDDLESLFDIDLKKCSKEALHEYVTTVTALISLLLRRSMIIFFQIIVECYQKIIFNVSMVHKRKKFL